MKKSITAVIIFLFLYSNSVAQDTQTDSVYMLTLKQAQELAIENNYDVRNKKIDIEIAKQKVWETTAIGLPQVNGQIQYQYYFDVPTTLMPDFITNAVVGVNMKYFGLRPTAELPETKYFPMQFGMPHNATWTVTASQLIFNGEYLVGLQASKTFKELSERNYAKSVRDIKEKITEAYVLVLAMQQNYNIVDSSLVNTEKIKQDMEQMQKAGFIDETDVDQINLTLLNLENTLNSLKRQVIFSKRLLKFQLGISMTDSVVLTDNLETILMETNLDNLALQDFNINNNIDYQLVQTQEHLSALSLKQQQSALLPRVSAFATYSKKAMRDEFDFFDSEQEWYPTSIIGFQVDIPLFGSGMKRAKIKQAKLELEKTQNMRLQVEQSLQIEYLQNKNNYLAAREKYDNSLKNKQYAEKIYLKSVSKYKEGTISSLELTQAQNQYFNAQNQYFQAALELLNAKAKLEKTLGIE